MAIFTVVFDPPSVPPMTGEAPSMELLADQILRHAQAHLTEHLDGIAISESFLNAYAGEGHVLSHPNQTASFTINQES